MWKIVLIISSFQSIPPICVSTNTDFLDLMVKVTNIPRTTKFKAKSETVLEINYRTTLAPMLYSRWEPQRAGFRQGYMQLDAGGPFPVGLYAVWIKIMGKLVTAFTECRGEDVLAFLVHLLLSSYFSVPSLPSSFLPSLLFFYSVSSSMS